MNLMKFGGFPEAIRLKYARHFIAEAKRKRKRENKGVLGRNCLYRTLLCTFITPMSFSQNEL